METFQGRVSRAVEMGVDDPFATPSDAHADKQSAPEKKFRYGHLWSEVFTKGLAVVFVLVLAIGATVGVLTKSLGSATTFDRANAPLGDDHLGVANNALNELQLASAAIRGLSGTTFMTAEIDRLALSVETLRNKADEIRSAFAPSDDENSQHPSGFIDAGLQNAAYRAAAALGEAARSIESNLMSIELGDESVVQRLPESLRHIDQAHIGVLAYLSVNIQKRTEQREMLENRLFWLTYFSEALLAVLTVALLVCLFLWRREGLLRKLRDSALRDVRRHAYFDPVTGLANRVHFTSIVEDSLHRGDKGALVLFDLDNFKDINDRHGHQIGDKVLREFAERINTETSSNNGLTARLGGDEFAVFLKTDNIRFLRHYLDALIEIFQSPMRFGDTTIHAGFSAGLATTTQLSMSQSVSLDKLMRVADFALYASKTAGRGRYTLYDADLEAQFLARRDLVNAMPYAAGCGELEVYFQPKFDLVTQEVVSFESLVRWQRDGKLLQPGDFIEVAEETGMIVEIDRYVLDRAVQYIAECNEMHGTRFSVSVNLSALHFRSASDLEFVKASLERHGLPPELLTLEITETVQLQNWGQVAPAVSALRALGVRISIDDFGAGFSSLAYLRMLHADELKIDHTLVQEIETSDQAQFILDAVLELAHQLGLSVVVEGLETESQLIRVREMGCRVGQGFLFAHPTPASQAIEAALQSLREPGVSAG